MRVLNGSRVIVLFAFLPQLGLAAIRPSFTGYGEAWRSTDIVVVSTSTADGTFVVDEVWKGDVLPGARSRWGQLFQMQKHIFLIITI